MSTQVQILRDTAAVNDGFTGPTGLLTADSEGKNLRLHDSIAAGGFRIAGPVIMDRVVTGTSHTVAIKGAETQVVWASSTSGAKTTTIPAASSLNNGCKLGIATTLANGDSHTISPAAGTIRGAATFTFTDNPQANVSLVSDAVGADWIVT